MSGLPTEPALSDVIQVRQGDELNWKVLEAWLVANVAGLEGPMTVGQFPGGHANLTYCVSFGDRELVVRRPPHGDIPPGAHDMHREHRVLAGLAPVFDRAPLSLAFCDDTSVIGAPFVVVERRNGVVVRDHLPDAWAGVEDVRRQISMALIDAMADLHSVDPASAGLATLGQPDGFVERQLSGWARRWEAVVGQSDEFDAVHQLLVSSQPATLAHCIVHNDFKLDNCMFSVDQPGRVSTILDWDMTTLGDPLIELGTLLSYWPASGSTMSRSPTIGLDMTGFPDRNELIERYRQSGFDVDAVDWYEAFGLWKLAVVLKQLHGRQGSDNRSADFGDRADDVLRAAADMALKYTTAT